MNAYNKWKEQSVDDVVKDLMRGYALLNQQIEEREKLLSEQRPEEPKISYKSFMKWRIKHYTEKIEGKD